jgi:streptogramin lyase
MVNNENLRPCKAKRRRHHEIITIPRVATLLLGLSLVASFIGVGVSGAIGAGTISNYSSSHISYPLAITAGPDGAVWFTNSLPPNGKGFGAGHNSIGRITMAGNLSVYTSMDIAEPSGITAGPDGALWFTNTGNGSIGRITTAGVVTSYQDPTISSPMGITAGPDGSLWFANYGDNSIGRITTTGVVTDNTNPTISGPVGITAGPDGALWFTNSGNNSIGRITTTGVVTDYTDATISQPSGITVGPDGALWFTQTGNDSIGRITTTGPLAITTSSLPHATVGTAYSQSLSAKGGNPPYTWKLVKGSGELPRGLRLDESTGTISGTPTTRSETSSFTVEVIDTKKGKPKTQNAATVSLTLTVSPAA